MTTQKTLADELSQLISRLPLEQRSGVHSMVEALRRAEDNAKPRPSFPEPPPRNYIKVVGVAALIGFVLPFLGWPVAVSLVLFVGAFMFAHFKEREEKLQREKRRLEAIAARAQAADELQRVTTSAQALIATLTEQIAQRGEFDLVAHVKREGWQADQPPSA